MEFAKRRRVDEPTDGDLGGFRAATQAATAKIAELARKGWPVGGVYSGEQGGHVVAASSSEHPRAAGSGLPNQAVGSNSNGTDRGGKASKVQAFLSKLGLEKYTAAFVARGLAPQQVRKMSDEELRQELGMPQEHAWLLKQAMGQLSNGTAQSDQRRDPQAQGRSTPGPLWGAASTTQEEEDLYARQMPMSVQMTMQMRMQMALEEASSSNADQSAIRMATLAAAATNDRPMGLGPASVGDESVDNSLYSLGQVAEESAQLAVSVAGVFSNQTMTDPVQVQALVEAAQQAAQRARWAANTMESYEPAEGVQKSWIEAMRNAGKHAAETAETAAQQCSLVVSGVTQQQEEVEVEDPEQRSNPGRVPCKFFLLGKCWKGTGCEFAHEQPDLKPRPLMLKREEECIYFARGQCTRGVACPFAHGPEELKEISRYVVTLKKEKSFLNRFRRN